MRSGSGMLVCADVWQGGSPRRVVSIDERDSRWEDPRPRFRVYVYDSCEVSTSGSTEVYEITGADVLQVIDWAQTHAGAERTYSVALVRVRERPGGDAESGVVWLVGVDGNDDTADDPAGRRAQERMLERRHDPVEVPRADRAERD